MIHCIRSGPVKLSPSHNLQFIPRDFFSYLDIGNQWLGNENKAGKFVDRRQSFTLMAIG